MARQERRVQGREDGARAADWDFWRGWLEEERVDLRQRVLQVMQAGVLPGFVLHHFACDCLERTAGLCRRQGRGLRGGWLEVVQKKREWIEGKVPWEEVYEARSRLQRMHTGEGGLVLQQAEWMILSSLTEEPETAARYASYYPLFPEDRRWQCSHLQAKLEVLLQERTGFLALLETRRSLLEGRSAWKVALEGRLFL